jgi:hypothetical protein
MAVVDDKIRPPCIMEQVGVAVGAGNLASSPLRATAVDLIAAVGAASARLHYGDQGIPIAGAALKPRGTPSDRIAAELAPMLWHLKAGGQDQTIARVAKLFAEWIALKAEFADEKTAALVPTFAAQVVHEWLSGRCPSCRGAGVQEKDRQGRLIAPRTFTRNSRLWQCEGCCGSGRGLPNPILRARTLGIDRATYDADGWYRRFRAGIVWLEHISKRLRRPLQVESGRRRIAP